MDFIHFNNFDHKQSTSYLFQIIQYHLKYFMLKIKLLNEKVSTLNVVFFLYFSSGSTDSTGGFS
jgi:hypothetical protein